MNALLGNAPVRDMLGHALTHGRLAQAYVFSGAEGVGKRTHAVWFAQLLLCDRRAPHALQPCGDCRACRRVSKMSHPDFFELTRLERPFPLWARQARLTRTFRMVGPLETRATMGIHHVSALRESARFAPMEGAWQIFLVPDAHRLNEQAQVSLLEALEEPREGRVFILTTPSHAVLLPTVVSRCQLVRFAPVPTADVSAWLVENGAAEERAVLAAAISEGRPGFAFRLATDDGLWAFRNQVVGQAAALLPCDRHQHMLIAEGLAALGRGLLARERTLEFLTGWFRDVAWLQRGLDEQRILNRDQVDALRRAATAYTFADVMHALDALRDARQLVAREVNGQLLFTRLLLHLAPSVE